MTRFLMSLDRAVDTVVAALEDGRPGETFVPLIPAARIGDLAEVMTDGLDIAIKEIGERPGEKPDEILVSEEEAPRTSRRGEFLVIAPILPELRGPASDLPEEALRRRHLQLGDSVIGPDDLRQLLAEHGVIGAAAQPGGA